MQNTLLAFGIALIAAIAAAFAAPLFVDWDAWRLQFEEQASALTGTRVTIRGKIDAVLLPTPAFVLRDVSLGDPDNGTGVRAYEVRGLLSLSALLTGKFEATEIVVSRPALRLALDEQGVLQLPQGVAAMDADALAVTAFSLEAGSLIVEDRRTKSLLLADDFSARGELLSRQGPFKLDGGFRLDRRRWILRASSARFGADQGGRVRLVLERPDDGISFESEGLLALTNAKPRYEGKVTLARTRGAWPWRAAFDASGDMNAIALSSLELSLGEGEAPLALQGSGRLSPRANGSLEVTLKSTRLDLDRGDKQAAARGFAHVVPMLGEVRDLVSGLPFAGRISLSADGVMARGQLVRELKAAIFVRGGIAGLEQLEAKLPGRGLIRLSGKTERDRFAGTLALDSAEPSVLTRWLFGPEISERFADAQTMQLKGNISASPEAVAFEKMEFTLGTLSLTGSMALASRQNASPLLRAKLAGTGVEPESLLALFMGWYEKAGIDLSAEVLLRKPKLFGRNAEQIDAALSGTDGKIAFERLVLRDFDGLNATIEQPQKSEKPAFNFTFEAAREGVLAALAERYLESAEAGREIARLASLALPARGSGGIFFEPDGAWDVRFISGGNNYHFTMTPPREGTRAVTGEAKLAGGTLSAKGALRFDADRKFRPVLEVAFQSEDIRKFAPAAERSTPYRPFAFWAKANLVRLDDKFVLDRITFQSAQGVNGSGQIALAPPGGMLRGDIKFTEIPLPVLAMLTLGSTERDDSQWSTDNFDIAFAARFNGEFAVEAARLKLSDRVHLRDVRFVAKVRSDEILLDNITGTFGEGTRGQKGGGRFSGSFRAIQSMPRSAELQLNFEGAPVSNLLDTFALRGEAGGSVNVSMTGNSPSQLVASLSGQGRVKVANFVLENADPNAIATVMAADIRKAPDEKAVEAMFAEALNRGHLRLDAIDAPFLLTNGILRFQAARAATVGVEVTANGTLDLNRLAMETQITLESPLSRKAGATLRWSGPFSAPERKLDTRALFAALSVKMIEREPRGDIKETPKQDVVPDLPPAIVVPDKKKRDRSSERPQQPNAVPPPLNLSPLPLTPGAPRERQIQN